MPRPHAKYTQELNRMHGDNCVNKQMIVALRMARKYRGKPTANELMRDFGMSRATAFRWLAAWTYVYEAANDG